MMKFKPNQTRTYDGEGFKKRAACLCFKNDREDEVKLRKVQMWFTFRLLLLLSPSETSEIDITSRFSIVFLVTNYIFYYTMTIPLINIRQHSDLSSWMLIW